MKLASLIISALCCLVACTKPKDKSMEFDESVYEQLKAGLGTDLPADYLQYLRTHGGEVPAPNYFWVVRGDWGSSINDLYVMRKGDEGQSLLSGLDWDGQPLKPGLIPIGGDGAFGYILLSLRPEDYGTVHFCCTWSDDGKTDVYESQGYWRIADNFRSFIDGLEAPPKK
jgi:hypothetical protein